MTAWVKVEVASELRAGITVELRPCGFCGRRERLTLLRAVTTGAPVSLDSQSGDFVDSSGAWTTAPGLCLHPKRPFDPAGAIATGRLWRLADEPPDFEVADTHTLERVRR